MISAWRTRAGRPAAKLEMSRDQQPGMEELDVPTNFRCPISLDLMKDPVTLSTGMTYDRESIEKWIEAGNQRCPVTNQELISHEQIPNHAIRKMIQNWCVENRSLGIERIPTPRIPVTPYQISEICAKISDATKRGDHRRCGDLVRKLKLWGRESERNKRCIARNGTGDVLCAAFESFAGRFPETHIEMLEDILTVLAWMFPIGKLGQAKLGSQNSLNSIVWILKNRDLAARQSAVSTLKELLLVNISIADVLAETEGISNVLFELIREPICPASTRATLMTINLMISRSNSCKTIVSRFLELGMVDSLLEILFDAEKRISEKALLILDKLCSYKEGRAKATSYVARGRLGGAVSRPRDKTGTGTARGRLGDAWTYRGRSTFGGDVSGTARETHSRPQGCYGGWADLGVDSGKYARELMSNSVAAVKEEPKGLVDPARVLEKAHSSTKAKGSSTACIIALTDQATSNALTVPVLVKKILRVSDLATELSISVLLKLCKSNGNKFEEEDLVASVIQPALQTGAFQKVLLVLQVGCGDRMKGKVTELLKILNLYKDKVKCYESSLDLKHLRRPF